MLELQVAQEIERLLHEGQLSQRKIAARLRVSRGVVSAIASGKRQVYGKQPGADPATTNRGRVVERCRECGNLVYMPCVACHARKYVRAESHRQQTPSLQPSHAQRNMVG